MGPEGSYTGSVARKLLWESKLRDSLGYISAGPARDLDLGTNSPSAPSSFLAWLLSAPTAARSYMSKGFSPSLRLRAYITSLQHAVFYGWLLRLQSNVDGDRERTS